MLTPDQRPIKMIDLNADLGEGGMHDAAILAIVSSANIACGGHTGDAHSMRAAIRLAQNSGVNLGAHPSFVDRENFGRSAQHPPTDLLFSQLCRQVNDLIEIAEQENCSVRHLKPHGALYNQAAHDPQLAEVLIRVIQHCDPTLTLFGLAGSNLLQLAQASGIQVKAEAFADRRYNNDGSLRARSFSDACIADDKEAVQQILGLIQHQQLCSVDGQVVHIEADTFCVHGDGEHALHLLSGIRKQLIAYGYQIGSQS
jgi:UPF0271 protein